MYGKDKSVSYKQKINIQTFACALDFSRNEIEASFDLFKVRLN
ncbi:hypothetical protein Bsph_3159 [Lysinibacillus sphaericus C3-41]|uniref:Uncharacterized protein n=1 Tax=Lysinibacillus sphaericus (strain C3-41) TaxID=444177 RepID=B1HQ27_LYSSC|nr:hypothetical protein Bsph_3159 [Lysinibacillus sphaericus C3-41]